MLTCRSRLDSGSLWDMHIHTPMRIHILMDIMDRPFMRGRQFTGPAGIAFLLRDIPVSTVFTIGNELT